MPAARSQPATRRPVDVRSDEDWQEGHVPGAIHLPEGDPETATKPLEEGARLLVSPRTASWPRRPPSSLAEKGVLTRRPWTAEWATGSPRATPIQPTADPDEDTELGLK